MAFALYSAAGRDNAAPWARPWACPGLYHITQARDGGLCRLRLAAGRLSLEDARLIAAAARAADVSVVEITNRANLQLRGISTERQAVLSDSLSAVSGADPATDRVRNIHASPTFGLDQQQWVDVGPIVDEFWQRLPLLPGADRLSAKFGVLVEGGAGSSYAGRPFDFVVAAVADGRLALGWGEVFPLVGEHLVTLAEEAAEVVLAAVGLLIELASGGERANAAVIRRTGRPMFEATLEARLGRRLGRATLAPAAFSGLVPLIGRTPQRQKGLEMVGAQPPLGRLSPEQLGCVADAVVAAGGEGLRLTPARALLATGVPTIAAAGLLDQFTRLGLLTDARHPLTRLIACAGSSGCAHGLADTQSDARTLAATLESGDPLPPGVVIHLSGCGKGCAHPLPAALTLAAAEGERYMLAGSDGACVSLPSTEALTHAASLAPTLSRT